MSGSSTHGVRAIRPDEVDAWCSCPLRTDSAGHDRWKAGERQWIEQWGHPPANLFVCQGADGAFLGKYDVPTERDGHWKLWAPSARTDADTAHVLGALCRHVVAEARRRGVERAELVVEESHRHFDLVRSCLVDAGFAPFADKVVVTRDLTDLGGAPPAARGDTVFRPASDAPLPDVLAAALRADSDPQGLDEWAAAVPTDSPGLVALQGDAVVGIALRSVQPGDRLLTLQHLGLVPRARGRGLGTRLLAETLRWAADAGFATYVGSTASDNTAMRRVFDRCGCELVGKRLVFQWVIG